MSNAIRKSVYRDGPSKTTATAAKKYKEYFHNFRKEIFYDDHILYTDLEEFKKFKNSKVLIVGGGPSTNELEWEKLHYDYLWSLNHFFLNPKLKNREVSLATICSEVDLLGEKFSKYISEYKPLLGFEVHISLNCPKHRKIVNSFYNINRTFCIYTKFYSKLGGGIRLAILAHYLGVKELHFVGLDGPKPIKEKRHSFENKKDTLPPTIAKMDIKQLTTFFRLQYEEFFHYMRKSPMKMQNLAENIGYNVIKDISKKQFPLRDDIKNELY